MISFEKKFLFLFLAFFLLFFTVSPHRIAAVTDEWCQEELEAGRLVNDQVHYDECIAFWEERRQEKSEQITTLKSELEKFDASIAITTAQIYQTVNEISELEKEISTLTTKIGHLDVSLDQLSQILVKRIAETYKKGKIDALALLLSSSNFSEFIGRYKYLRVIQIHDRRLMIQMETVRTNYADQKTVKEEKQAELEAAKSKLESQKALLAQQKKEKEALLIATQNSERNYQALVRKAREQLAAIRSLVSLRGGATLLPSQTVCDSWGCYYNQRDSAWGTQLLGVSNLSVAEYGCLVSSAAMVASHYNHNLTPADIAAEPSAFFSPDSDTALLYKEITVKGINIKRIDTSLDSIDSELAAGKPVIVGLYYGPAHFVTLKSGSNGNYIMHDPWYEGGHDIPFSDHYSVADITEVNIVEVY